MLAGFAAAALSQPTSCLVVGAKDAKVSSSEGERSPAFVARACDSLKLLSGAAQASWVARDGKVRTVPITSAGVSGAPAPGAEERSVNVVWAELTSRRERQQPAYMRSFGQDRIPSVYVPPGGLTLLGEIDGEARVRIANEAGELIREFNVQAGQPLSLSRSMLEAGKTYTVQIQRGAMIEEWKWRITP
ncbi:MAG: hypothetical protein ACOVPA_23410, partial [Rubrivivax sp.]